MHWTIHISIWRWRRTSPYEAYLIVLGFFAIIPALSESASKGLTPKGERKRVSYLGLTMIVLISCLPLLNRSAFAFNQIARATQDIYSQQYQMAKFLQDYYQGQEVALNDIGVVNYLADVHCLDLWGLADREVLKEKRARTYDSDSMANLARANSVKVAIVYDDWFAEFGGVPSQWVMAGQWMTPNNIILGSNTVTFYAVDPSEAIRLAENLRTYSPNLPSHVLVRFTQ